MTRQGQIWGGGVCVCGNNGKKLAQILSSINEFIKSEKVFVKTVSTHTFYFNFLHDFIRIHKQLLF